MGRRGSVWGEGLVDDSWAQVAGVDRWDRVHPDEMLRLYPALVATAVRSQPLIGRLEQAIAVRWRRLSMRAGGQALRLRSLDENALTLLADAHERAWFSHAGRLRSALDRLLGIGPGPVAPTPGEEAAVLALDDILIAWRDGRTAPYAEHRALNLAFYAGIHPAYLWREAVTVHECATAIGWLGVVARGRDALLPRDVAATLADSIVRSAAATGWPRDQRFALCGLTPFQWGAIGEAARHCLEGDRKIVRLRHAATRVGLRSSGRRTPALPARESAASFRAR